MGHKKENYMNSKKTCIFLAGGGEVDDSRPLDEQFVEMLDSTKPLVYIPNAMRSKPYQSCLEWFRSVMTPLGVITIEMWDDLQPRRPATDIAGMYIGGGDTLKLLKEIREADFDKYLHRVAQDGTPLYGGSAGAIILGEDIRTAPEARHLVASKATGIKIVEGYSIICHYSPKIEKATQTLSKELNQRIIAIPEKAGGYIIERTLTNYGTESIIVFRENGIDIINPNHSINL